MPDWTPVVSFTMTDNSLNRSLNLVSTAQQVLLKSQNWFKPGIDLCWPKKLQITPNCSFDTSIDENGPGEAYLLSFYAVNKSMSDSFNRWFGESLFCNFCKKTDMQNGQLFPGPGIKICTHCLLRAVYIMLNFGSITSEEIIQTIEDLGKMEKTTGGFHTYQKIYDHFSMIINKPSEPEPKPEENDIPDITA